MRLDDVINQLIDQIVEEEREQTTSIIGFKRKSTDEFSSASSSSSDYYFPEKRSLPERAVINNISKDPNKIRVPRVLRRDFRMKYPIMFINMMNMGNLSSIVDFMIHFVTPNCLFHEMLGHNPGDGSTCRTLQNIVQITQFIYCLNLSCPDGITTMKESKIITKSNTMKTEIIIDFEFNATKMYDLTPSDVGVLLRSLPSPSVDKILEMENDSNSSLLALTELFQERFSFNETPQIMKAIGRIKLIINNHQESCKLDEIFFQPLGMQFLPSPPVPTC